MAFLLAARTSAKLRSGYRAPSRMPMRQPCSRMLPCNICPTGWPAWVLPPARRSWGPRAHLGFCCTLRGCAHVAGTSVVVATSEHTVLSVTCSPSPFGCKPLNFQCLSRGHSPRLPPGSELEGGAGSCGVSLPLSPSGPASPEGSSSVGTRLHHGCYCRWCAAG